MKVGTEVYYRGDMANHEGEGVIFMVRTTEWGTDYGIHMDDGREFTVTASSFSAGNARYPRVSIKSDWERERRRELAASAMRMRITAPRRAS